MNKARVTYRFDENGKVVRDEPAESAPGSVVSVPRKEASGGTTGWREFARDYDAWSDDIADVARLERLIRDADADGRRSSGTADFSNAAGESLSLVEVESHERSGLRSRYRPPAFLKTVLSALAAVATGLACGYLVLFWFSASGDEGRQRGQPTDAEAALSTSGRSVSAGAVVVLPEARYVFLQVGAFRSAEGAKTAADALKSEGLAAAVENGDPHLVFAGVATGKEEARALVARLQDGTREIFLKEKTVPNVRYVRWGAGMQEAAASFEAAHKLAETVVRLTSLRLGSGDIRKMDEATFAGLRSAHQAFDAAFKAAAPGVPAEGKAAFDRIDRALDAAVLALENYNRAPSTALLWQAQNAVIDSLLAENELAVALAVPGAG
ncbi:MAG: hypothetical protein BLM47_08145 [Candidatus Reconcilbacillus cellulovorans]|uniref:SPOR domain-containing protein n=1 Tax=Candidatus Reconcilbacillus cellulovorans TaxID=1906605 RepID=A0A2A6DZM2_9BACL|nr:MAG: hypothetical protein BLM47_08145 [Candidatus Reconcilbacillus cellulovorans]